MKKLIAISTLIVVSMQLNIFYGQNYDPDFFPIGVWSVKGDFRSVDDFLYNPVTAAQYHETSFTNLKNEGFNSVFLAYDPIGYTLDSILNIAERHNMKVISSMQHLYEVISQSNDQTVTTNDIIQAIENDSINRLKQSPAVLGYYLYDEPLPGWIDFDVLENAKNILMQMTSDAPHPILSAWNDEQHMDYIDSYLHPEVLMMDTYPFEDGDAIGDISDYMPSYFANGDPMPFSDYLNTVYQNHCSQQNRPMWVILQAFGDVETPENGGYWRQVYPKEIRLEVYLSVMNGAKGIWYFLYESEYPYLLGLLDESGQPTQRLTEVVNINNEINTISPILLKLKVAEDQSGVSTDLGKIKLHYDTTTPNQEKYIIAVNTDVSNISNPTIHINKNAIGYDVLSIINMLNNQQISFTETTDEIILTTPIDSGSGVLLKLSNQAVSIDEMNIKKQIQIYPNPVTDNLFIHANYIQAESYELYNIYGDKIMYGKIHDNEAINMNKVSEGIYFIKINTPKGFVTYKVLKV